MKTGKSNTKITQKGIDDYASMTAAEDQVESPNQGRSGSWDAKKAPSHGRKLETGWPAADKALRRHHVT